MDVLLCCERGRECVINIRELMIKIMKTLHRLNPNEMRKKDILQQCLADIHKHFHNLKIFYNICEAKTPKFTDLESFIPFADKMLTKERTGEAYAEAYKEQDALKQEVALKNQQLAEVITHMRNTVFSINCMLACANASNEEKN